MSEIKTLVRGEEKARVEAGSQAEAEAKALGFEEPEAEDDGDDKKPGGDGTKKGTKKK